MPHLPTSPYFERQSQSPLLALLSRWSLLAALALPLSACDPNAGDDDDSSESDTEEDDDKSNKDSDGDEDDKKDSDGEEDDKKDSDGNDAKDSDGEDSTTGDSTEEENQDTGSTGTGTEDSSGENNTDTETGTETGSDGNTDPGTDTGTDTTDENNKKRDCSKIQWGSGLAKGEVIPRSDVRGFLDSDGDKKADDTETDVGMCALHQTDAKCGLVVTGFMG